jgi:hypothetical protein
MIDMYREACRGMARALLSLHGSSKQGHNPVDFDEMAHAINEEKLEMLTGGWCDEQMHNDGR